MRPKLLLLALCAGVMLGQNGPALVGLPEYGVTLTGSAEHPEIVNNSGRTILGYVLWQRDANGGGMLPAPTILTDKLRRANIPPPTGPFAVAPQVRSRGSGTPVPPTSTIAGSIDFGNFTSPPVEAILDAVVFDDGQFVGPDNLRSFDLHSFERMSVEIDAERSLAQDILAGRISWEQLDARAQQFDTRVRERKPTPEGQVGHPPNIEALIEAVTRDSAQRLLIQDLLQVRAKYGEAAALTIADWSAKLPVLWRAK